MRENVIGQLRRTCLICFSVLAIWQPYPALSKQVESETSSAAVKAVEDLKTGDVAMLPQKSGKIRMTIIAADGFVSFSPRQDWRIGGMQSRPPVTQTVFQLPNQADEGTSNSTNLVVSVIRPESDKSAAAIAHIGKKFGAGDVAEGKHKGWKTWTQDAEQNGTPYSVIDARRDDVAGQIVWARVAWPHLKNNPPDYDKTMEKEFYALIDSVTGKTGAYHPQPGEIVRRPE